MNIYKVGYLIESGGTVAQGEIPCQGIPSSYIAWSRFSLRPAKSRAASVALVYRIHLDCERLIYETLIRVPNPFDLIPLQKPYVRLRDSEKIIHPAQKRMIPPPWIIACRE